MKKPSLASSVAQTIYSMDDLNNALRTYETRTARHGPTQSTHDHLLPRIRNCLESTKFSQKCLIYLICESSMNFKSFFCQYSRCVFQIDQLSQNNFVSSFLFKTWLRAHN